MRDATPEWRENKQRSLQIREWRQLPIGIKASVFEFSGVAHFVIYPLECNIEIPRGL